MHNWCYTDISITGNPDEVGLLWKHLENATSKNFVSNDFGKEWLGNIVCYLNENWEKVGCRGAIYFKDIDYNCISISTETAWSPKLAPFIMMMKRYAPSSKLTFSSNDEMNEFYISNNPQLVGKYIIDDWNKCLGFQENDGLFTDSELRDLIIKNLEDDSLRDKSTDELIGLIMDKYNNDFQIMKYESAEIEDYC